MKKLTTKIVLSLLCLYFPVSAQDFKSCKSNTTPTYNYGLGKYNSILKKGVWVLPASLTKGKRLIARNQTLPELLVIALSAGSKMDCDSVFIDVREPKKLNEIFCYELSVPAELNDVVYFTMQQNLKYLFPNYIAIVSGRRLTIKDADEL